LVFSTVFLSELLFSDIKIIATDTSDRLESESDREYNDNKQNQVDIKVEDSNGQLIFNRGVIFQRAVSSIFIFVPKKSTCIYHGMTEFYGLHNQHKRDLNKEQKELFSCEKVADIFEMSNHPIHDRCGYRQDQPVTRRRSKTDSARVW
jgi:hypothetical protein